MNREKTDMQKLSDDELKEVLDSTREQAAWYKQVTDIAFWMGTILAGASVLGAAAAIGIVSGGAGLPLTAAMAAGVAGAGSFAYSTKTNRQCEQFKEVNDMAFSMRQARDNAVELVGELKQTAADTALVEPSQQAPSHHWRNAVGGPKPTSQLAALQERMAASEAAQNTISV